ncbi:MAG: RNA methyltransferase, partial [Bacteroidaceae bacterium]|nr:RNA methyltransferase [Bacteroidaceae bacterium]
MTETITSAQNPRIKRLLALQQKSSERRKAGLFVIEGQRELQHCVGAGYEVESMFVCEEMVDVGSLAIPCVDA